MASKAEKAQIIDSKHFSDALVNLVSGMGTSKDKGATGEFEEVMYDRVELEGMYTNDWLSGKIVDIPVDDMTREWRQITTPDMTPEQVKQYEKAEKAIGIQPAINECMKWARLYGGALIVMGIDGTGEPWEPLDVNRVKKGSLKFLHVIDRHEATVSQINQTDPTQANYRMPEWYNMVNGRPVHHTRVLRFDGIWTPWRIRKRYNYWGISILQRIYEALTNAANAAGSSSSLIQEASVTVMKIRDLMQQVATQKGENDLVNRFAIANIMKSNWNSLILDKEEEFEKHNQSFSGLPDLISKFLLIVSGAADIPATRLFGQSPQGLNATGDSDLTNYYDSISAKQVAIIGPQLDYFDEILTRSTFGSMPEDWEYEFRSLWQLSDSEKSTVEFTNAQRDQIYLANGVITEDIIAGELLEEGVYSPLTDEYVEELKSALELIGEDDDEDLLGEDDDDLLGEDDDDSSSADQESEAESDSESEE